MTEEVVHGRFLDLIGVRHSLTSRRTRGGGRRPYATPYQRWLLRRYDTSPGACDRKGLTVQEVCDYIVRALNPQDQEHYATPYEFRILREFGFTPEMCKRAGCTVKGVVATLEERKEEERIKAKESQRRRDTQAGRKKHRSPSPSRPRPPSPSISSRAAPRESNRHEGHHNVHRPYPPRAERQRHKAEKEQAEKQKGEQHNNSRPAPPAVSRTIPLPEASVEPRPPRSQRRIVTGSDGMEAERHQQGRDVQAGRENRHPPLPSRPPSPSSLEPGNESGRPQEGSADRTQLSSRLEPSREHGDESGRPLERSATRAQLSNLVELSREGSDSWHRQQTQTADQNTEVLPVGQAPSSTWRRSDPSRSLSHNDVTGTQSEFTLPRDPWQYARMSFDERSMQRRQHHEAETSSRSNAPPTDESRE